MSNYVKATNFATKDGLPSGNPGKIIKGTEIDIEFNAIAAAISSKADTNSPTLTGTPLAPTAATVTNNTQIATTAFVKNSVTAAIPAGIIMLWSGSQATIPSGWLLCDGTNGTPDLRGRFIIGAGSIAASVTGTAGASVTGSISGTTLTVSAVSYGTLAVNDTVSHASLLNTTLISGLGTGTGTTGTYTLSYTGSTSSFTGSISGTTLTVTAVSAGTIIVDQEITGGSVTAGTKITAQLTGTAGGIGTYTVSISQTRSSASMTGTFVLASTTLTIKSTKLTVSAVASGTLAVGQFLTGTGIDFGTSITALGTGSGGVGTYTLNAGQAFASTTISASAGTVTVGTTGGSKDAIVPLHTHTATSGVTDPGHAHTLPTGEGYQTGAQPYFGGTSVLGTTKNSGSNTTGISVTTTVASTGSSTTNANLPPYYALCYIMKS
jgi:hypothetical protein